MIEAISFYALTGLMLAAACSVVFNRQPLYSVLSLLVVVCCLAGLFVLLGAYFVAALQVLLYAGAVLVLFLFVIMLLNLGPDTLDRLRPFTLRATGTAMAILLLANLLPILRSRAEPPLAAVPEAASTVESIGRALFTAYLLPFELTSFLILAAIIGAVTLTKRQPPAE